MHSESGRNRGYYRGVAEEHVLRRAPDEHGDRGVGGVERVWPR